MKLSPRLKRFLIYFAFAFGACLLVDCLYYPEIKVALRQAVLGTFSSTFLIAFSLFFIRYKFDTPLTGSKRKNMLLLLVGGYIFVMGFLLFGSYMFYGIVEPAHTLPMTIGATVLFFDTGYLTVKIKNSPTPPAVPDRL